MSKQTKILKTILSLFDSLQNDFLVQRKYRLQTELEIKQLFKKSLNKNEIIRRILNDVVLSNDEIIELLRIIYKIKE